MKEKTISAVVSLLKVKSIITLLSFGAFFYLIGNCFLLENCIYLYAKQKMGMRKHIHLK